MRTRGLGVAALLATGGCKEEAPLVVYESVPVSQRDIVVAVRAVGSILPDTVVEVKSKASGEILEMRVETGQQVQRGQLLVKIDQRVPRNRLAEATATLDVIRVRLATAESQMRRSDELFKSKSITEQEYENAQLAVANAKALVEFVSTHSEQENLQYTVTALADAWESAELREGIQAFFQKRKPNWQA